MKKTVCIVLILLLLGTAVQASAVSLDEYATLEGMALSWYQGYSPIIKNNTLYLHLPLRSESCVGDITVSIALEDPHVFLLSGEPKEVTVSPKNGIYPVILRLPLERDRRNGDYPALITVTGTDSAGKTVTETIPYIIRIRDGKESHETFAPVITDVIGDLEPGRSSSVSVTLTNPTTTLSMLAGELTVADPSGQILTDGSERIPVPEVLPGQSVTVSVPVTVFGGAEILPHRLEISLRYQILDRDAQWTGWFTVPVAQAIRLEQGAPQLPEAIAGDLATLTLPLMNMGKGSLQNVLVKLEMEGVLEPQSVLVGTIAPGETSQAKLTFTPKPGSLGIHSGTVTVSCEDAYGNTSTQTLEVTLTVEAPIPEAEGRQEEEPGSLPTGTVTLIILCVLLAAGWIVHTVSLTKKLHRLEEERL